MSTLAVITPGGALARPTVDVDELLAGWLLSLGGTVTGAWGPADRERAPWLELVPPTNTRRAYWADMRHYGAWCADRGVELLAVRLDAVNLYRAELEGAGLTPSTVARRLSALASFYRYARDRGLRPDAPTDRVRRPRVGDETPRLGLDRDEARRLLEVAEAAGPRDRALVALLLGAGLRVSEALALEVADLDLERGHRVARIVGKGGRPRVTVLPAPVAVALDAVIGARTEGRVIVDAEGGALTRHQAGRIVARLARAAGMSKRVSPHSLRHAYVTLALDAGVPLHRVQDGAGHASPVTTRRYDRARGALDGHANYQLAAYLAA